MTGIPDELEQAGTDAIKRFVVGQMLPQSLQIVQHSREFAREVLLAIGLPALLERVEAAEVKVADYERGIVWDTTCLNCAKDIEESYAQTKPQKFVFVKRCTDGAGHSGEHHYRPDPHGLPERKQCRVALDEGQKP